ncbi:succinate dehydrogenase assembly factor 2 [Neorickettsia sennetsu]|uniref:FAD assembly factor SdhE n=1 Tax=Ehrlichia sennetsu (strain ATCC VR-367 / Miyayama) TaxID=222891 RepID=Q2GCJ1_EHRS3|nr:succinate dehydrogenase assembly factor 2 [Neorickettsia sennetsu]ABD46373.1 conserved hypothetical protein [Neorickettsia sennetsu str. Miyayama]
MNIDLRKKRILYRSTHRGCKEIDILLGSFITKNLSKLTEQEVEQVECILELSDSFIFDCYQGKVEPPEEFPILKRMVQEENR